MGKCECGSETDWTEIGGTWICVACRGEEISRLMRELREGLERIEEADRSLRQLRADTLSIPDLIDELKQKIAGIKVV